MEKKKKMSYPKRGFASMSKKKQKEIARQGGLAVSKDRNHMSKIGKKGGMVSAKLRIKK